jgi:hypothetical protein
MIHLKCKENLFLFTIGFGMFVRVDERVYVCASVNFFLSVCVCKRFSFPLPPSLLFFFISKGKYKKKKKKNPHHS